MPLPVIPGNFYAAGLNFRAHIEWANSRGGNYKVPEQADIGDRANNALIGSGDDIVIPADCSGTRSTRSGARRTPTPSSRWGRASSPASIR